MLVVLQYQVGWKTEGNTHVAQCPMAQEIYRDSNTVVVLRFSVYISLAMACSTISESHVCFWKTTCWMSRCSPLAGSPQVLLLWIKGRAVTAWMIIALLLHACLISMLFAVTFVFEQGTINGGLLLKCFIWDNFGWNAVQFNTLGDFGGRMFSEKARKEEGLFQGVVRSFIQSCMGTYIYSQSSWQTVFNLCAKGQRS